MRLRLVAGVVLCALGALWFFQGIGTIGGSGMSGQGFWAFAGAILVVAGAGLLIRARRAQRAGARRQH